MAFTAIKSFPAKAPLDNAPTQMNRISEWIGTDGGAMYVIRHKESLEMLKGVLEDIKAKKCTKPILRLGTDGSDLVVRVEGEAKYLKSSVVVKGYVKEKAKRAKTTVVNAQKGDDVIDEATADMARIKGTKGKDAKTVDLNAKGDKAPIVLLAHGSPAGNSPGKIFASHFADKTPEQIVRFLADEKKLAKNYAGVIYLDGCYTAAGPKKGTTPGELTNFAKKVYDGLVKKGYKYLQVKGNLGRAATKSNGDENVLDAQEEQRHKDRQAKLSTKYDEITVKAEEVDKRMKTLETVSGKLVAKHKGDSQKIKADPGLALLKQEMDKLQADREKYASKLNEMAKEYKDLAKDMKPGGKFRIDNLVGTFGPEKISSKPWYKKLFG